MENLKQPEGVILACEEDSGELRKGVLLHLSLVPMSGWIRLSTQSSGEIEC